MVCRGKAQKSKRNRLVIVPGHHGMTETGKQVTLLPVYLFTCLHFHLLAKYPHVSPGLFAIGVTYQLCIARHLVL